MAARAALRSLQPRSAVTDRPVRRHPQGSSGRSEAGSRAALPKLEAMVLSNPRIELSSLAAGDVAAGRIDPRVLEVLLVLAERFDLGSVGPLIGHSYFVAGTTTPSNHSFGRAVDISVIDGQAVSIYNPAARDAMELVLSPAAAPSRRARRSVALYHAGVRTFTGPPRPHPHRVGRMMLARDPAKTRDVCFGSCSIRSASPATLRALKEFALDRIAWMARGRDRDRVDRYLALLSLGAAAAFGKALAGSASFLRRRSIRSRRGCCG